MKPPKEQPSHCMWCNQRHFGGIYAPGCRYKAPQDALMGLLGRKEGDDSGNGDGRATGASMDDLTKGKP